MTADLLSDVLRAVRFRGALFFDVEGRAPWVAEAPPARLLLPDVMPDADHLMEFHGVLRGTCWAALTGEAAVALEEGDLVLFPHGDAHVMSSAPGLRAERLDPASLVPSRTARRPLPLVVDGHGVARARLRSEGPGATRLICGFVGCDARPYNPLLASLPRVLAVKGGARSAPWVPALLDSAAEESRRGGPGADVVLARMSEVLFVEAVRRHVETLSPAESSWLAATKDPLVSRVLTALHAAPAEPWTLERLTATLKTSRSTLHERFTQRVGIPPMQYLARWRMQLASRRLRDTPAKVLQVALEVGYDSEAAFTRAFHRLVGTTPGAWRRAATAAPATAAGACAAAVAPSARASTPRSATRRPPRRVRG